MLASGVHLIIVSSGRLGMTAGGFDIDCRRASRAWHGSYEAGRFALGPVHRVESPLGEGWRSTSRFGRHVVTDTYVDHDGWAYVIGVLSSAQHARAVEAYDAVLATWQWISADES